MQTVKVQTSDSYQTYLVESLRNNPELAAEYLTATLEEDNPEPELLRQALWQVTEALGVHREGITTELQRELLDQLFEEQGSEAIYRLLQWLNCLGLKLEVVVADRSMQTNL
jgi:DNA-binding phage protein